VAVCEASHSPPSVGNLKSAWSITSTVPHVCVWRSICHRKILTFFSLSNIFTKSKNRVPIHTISLLLLGQILRKKYIKFLTLMEVTSINNKYSSR
jgi:hypothetical protein